MAILLRFLGRDNKVMKTFAADPSKAVFEGKAVVLIDLGTAGPGEVVASAFIDRKRGDVVGERSFGSGTEQQLFALRGGDGLLLTTAKGLASGKPFLGDDRASMGVKPTVEVKRPDTPEPIEVEELIDRQDDENKNPQPTASPTPSAQPKPVLEDLQLRKASRCFRTKLRRPARANKDKCILR